MASSAARRVTLGFQGGQVLALRVSDKQLEDLNKAIGGIGWHELESEDGPVRVDLGQVVYVSADSDEPRVWTSACCGWHAPAGTRRAPSVPWLGSRGWGSTRAFGLRLGLLGRYSTGSASESGGERRRLLRVCTR